MLLEKRIIFTYFRGCLNEFMFKKFNEIKFQDDKRIKGGEILKLFYDFDACKHPLLEASY